MTNELNSPAAPHDAEAAVTTETGAENRRELATKLVDRFALWSGVAGLIPVPVVDAATVAGLQLQMVRPPKDRAHHLRPASTVSCLPRSPFIPRTRPMSWQMLTPLPVQRYVYYFIIAARHN